MNILILTGRFGMGHYSAATTLAQEMKQQCPNANINVQDIFEYISPNHYQNFYNCYTMLVNKASVFYNTYYRLTEKKQKNVKVPVMPYFFSILKKMLEQFQPDVIFSTLPLCSQLVSHYKNHYYLPAPLVTCITDISTHNEWINDNTSYYLVGSTSVKQQLIEKEVPSSQIYVTGIPVKAQFKEPHPAYGTPKRQLLIMGGGLGLIPKDRTFYEQLNALPNVKTTIILGSNQEMYDALHGVYENIEVVGYTSRVYEYMQKADVLLSKPGGITMFETIYSELPMIVLCPFLEQEIKNANFIMRHGIGKVLWDKNEDVVASIEQFLCDDHLLAQIRRNMNQFKQGLETDAVEKILSCVVARPDTAAVPRAVAVPRKGVVA